MAAAASTPLQASTIVGPVDGFQPEGGHLPVAGSSHPTAGPLPPWAQLHDFLPEPDRQALLGYVIASENRFAPAAVIDGVGDSNRYDASARSALTLRDLGPSGSLLRERLLGALPTLMERTGARPPEPRSLELELAAYGDGAYFSPHVDMAVGPGRKPLGAAPGEDRVLSAVYYFHSHPRRFSGGELTLYRFGVEPRIAPPDSSIIIEPLDNSLAVFPSWVTHEVRPTSCPSGEFADYRFSLNCWFCRTLSSPR